MNEQVTEVGSGEEILLFTQRKRMELVEAITKEKMPDENKDRLTLLAALDGMDRQELGKQKIDASKNSTASDRLVAQALISLVSGGLRGTNPFETDAPQTNPHIHAQPVFDGDDIEVVPGETDVGLSTDNLTSFAGRTGMDLSTIAGASQNTGGSEFSEKPNRDA